MKKLSAKEQQKQHDEIIAACERTRQACNRLTDEERHELNRRALALIHGHDAKDSARSR